MIVWILILICLAAVYLGFKRGFFFMFATLFHMMFALYIAVLSAPRVIAISPGLETNGYYAGACVLVLFLLLFAVLEGFGWFFFLRDREGFFPLMLEKAGGAMFGFLCGYVFASTVLISLCIMPCSRGQMDWLCTRDNLRGLSTPGVFRACNFLGWYSLECFDGNVERAVDSLLSLNDPKEEEVIPVILPEELTAGQPKTVGAKPASPAETPPVPNTILQPDPVTPKAASNEVAVPESASSAVTTPDQNGI
jgi:hypothetical protein